MSLTFGKYIFTQDYSRNSKLILINKQSIKVKFPYFGENCYREENWRIIEISTSNEKGWTKPELYKAIQKEYKNYYSNKENPRYDKYKSLVLRSLRQNFWDEEGHDYELDVRPNDKPDSKKDYLTPVDNSSSEED